VKKRDIDFEIAVGQNVKEMREKLNWSQKHLADIANLEQNQVQRVENAKNTTSLAILTAIAKALGKQPYEILKVDRHVKVNTSFEVPKRKSPKTTSIVLEISKSNFLNSPKRVMEIVKYAKEKFGTNIPSSATSATLKRLVDEKVLKRLPDKISGRYCYQKR
jgi:transcriptional regulator with XRE-family HTH domain